MTHMPLESARLDPARIEYDLHGLLGVRVLDAAPDDAARLQGQLGMAPAPLERAPDIVLRYVDRLPRRSQQQDLQEQPRAADDSVVVRAPRLGRGGIRLPLDRIGLPEGGCEIVCERGTRPLPLLSSILNLTVLARGALPLHATAFTWRGVGCAATGVSGSGKTAALLAFLSHGAAYIGAEWPYVTADGGEILGRRELVRVRAWHLRELPQYARLVRRADVVRLAGLHAPIRWLNAATARLRRRGAFVRELSRVDRLERKLYVDLPPETLAGGTVGPMRARFGRLYLLVRGEATGIRVDRVDPRRAVELLVPALRSDFQQLLRLYQTFRAAFPGRPNPVLEGLEALQRETLSRVLQGKEILLVEHPPHGSIESLFRSLER